MKEIKVLKTKNGRETVLEIDGLRYVLDMKTQKNKKVEKNPKVQNKTADN